MTRLFSFHISLFLFGYSVTLASYGLTWLGFGRHKEHSNHTKTWHFGILSLSVMNDKLYYQEVDQVLNKLFGKDGGGMEGIRVLKVDGKPIHQDWLDEDGSGETHAPLNKEDLN